MGDIAFAYRLLSQLPRKGNLFFSPHSIRRALAMVYEGSVGPTRDEMTRVCDFPDLGIMRQMVMSRKGSCLHEANNVWVAAGLPVGIPFQAILDAIYNAPLRKADFGQVEATRAEINQWVEEQTRKRIQNLIGPKDIGPLTLMVLVNAIYFKDRWYTRFNPVNTRNDLPFLAPEGEIKPPFMSLQARPGYAEGDTWEYLDLPFASGLSFGVLLPKSPDGLPDIEAALMAGTFRFNPCERKTVHVFLPRFRVEYGFSVKEALEALGMRTAFSAEADFRGIADGRLKLDDVIHKAFCEVEEQGVEAAAATGVQGFQGYQGNMTDDYKVFYARSPFLFMIWEKVGGNVLFMGRMENPEK